MTTRHQLIYDLCREAGGWGDGSKCTEESMCRAAEHPGMYDIDAEDLDGACEGDTNATLRLRSAWGLNPFC